MKYIYLSFFALITFVSVFLSSPSKSFADNFSMVLSAPTVTVDNGKGQAAITGSFDAASGKYLHSGTYDNLVLAYGKYTTDGGPKGLPSGSLNSDPAIGFVTVACFTSGTSDPNGNKCSIKYNSDNSGSITAVITGLLNGTYGVYAFFRNSDNGKYSSIGNTGQAFTVGGGTDAEGLAITFGSATTPTPTASKTIGVPGYSFDVTMNIAHLSETTPMYIQLGIANQDGATSRYICSDGGGQNPSKTITIDPTTAVVAKTFTLDGITDGNYCVSLQRIVPGGYAAFKTGANAEVDGQGYYMAGRTIIHVGNAPPLVVGATNDGSANPTGCVTKDDNSNYCLLAPLPGMGDGTGNLDVKNFGDYIGIIIKIVFGLIGVLSVLMIVIGGIEYMSTVSIGEKEGAKSRITSALMGLLLALASYIILNTLNPDLVSLGVHIPSVTVPLEENFVPTSGGGQATGGGVDSNVNEKISTYDVMLAASSQKYGVECTLMKALMYAESGGKLDATSNVGAKGLIQLMPATFKDQGFNDPTLITDPASNIDAASSYIGKLEKKGCNGAASNNVCNVNDWKYVIAAYNGGPGANSYSDVCKKGQGVDTTAWQCTLNVKGYTQTRNYVQKVMNNYNKLKANADKGWAC